jgi:hypothetical protein
VDSGTNRSATKAKKYSFFWPGFVARLDCKGKKQAMASKQLLLADSHLNSRPVYETLQKEI